MWARASEPSAQAPLAWRRAPASAGEPRRAPVLQRAPALRQRQARREALRSTDSTASTTCSRLCSGRRPHAPRPGCPSERSRRPGSPRPGMLRRAARECCRPGLAHNRCRSGSRVGSASRTRRTAHPRAAVRLGPGRGEEPLGGRPRGGRSRSPVRGGASERLRVGSPPPARAGDGRNPGKTTPSRDWPVRSGHRSTTGRRGTLGLGRVKLYASFGAALTSVTARLAPRSRPRSSRYVPAQTQKSGRHAVGRRSRSSRAAATTDKTGPRR